MRYFLFILVLVVVFTHRSPDASSGVGTIYNCLPDEIQWCSYDGSSFWDTIYPYSAASVDSGDSTDVYCLSSSCYVIVEETSDVYLCTDYNVDGSIDDGDTACIGYDDNDDITWTGGSSADTYECEDNVCVAE